MLTFLVQELLLLGFRIVESEHERPLFGLGLLGSRFFDDGLQFVLSGRDGRFGSGLVADFDDGVRRGLFDR